MDYESFKRELCNRWLIEQIDPLYNLHSALQQIALKIFKIIPQRKIHLCHDIESALRLLEKWKLLSEERLEIIIEFTNLLEGPTEKIRNELRKFKPRYETTSYCHCYENHFNSHCGNYENSFEESNHIDVSKYEPIYSYLSENMGTNQSWIDLGRMLPRMRNKTEELRSDSGLRQKDKILKMLEEFEYSLGGENPITVILQCLERRQLRRQCDFIKENFAHLL
ncbi:hypothetical protein Anas_04120 [Armadillidium nasatum]|uniref:Death domain-containing protein n=1 Tax=Armadillidium nasatum TaxID=96803 RepID=A0A5N5SNA8_9CRUS|nr:hypothetical protein Anas_04120 [Armadillidium nasatum]